MTLCEQISAARARFKEAQRNVVRLERDYVKVEEKRQKIYDDRFDAWGEESRAKGALIDLIDKWRAIEDEVDGR